MEKLFKVGDIARVKYIPQVRVFILEVHEQTCYANVAQIWYTIRQFGVGKPSKISQELTKMSAIELEPIPPISLELNAMIADYKACKAEKAHFTKEQNFDAASKISEKEMLLKLEIINLVEKEDVDINEFIF